MTAIVPVATANVKNKLFYISIFYIGKKKNISIRQTTIYPAKTFGWGIVPYGRRINSPSIEAFAMPGVWELKNLSPKK